MPFTLWSPSTSNAVSVQLLTTSIHRFLQCWGWARNKCNHRRTTLNYARGMRIVALLAVRNTTKRQTLINSDPKSTEQWAFSEWRRRRTSPDRSRGREGGGGHNKFWKTTTRVSVCLLFSYTTYSLPNELTSWFWQQSPQRSMLPVSFDRWSSSTSLVGENWRPQTIEWDLYYFVCCPPHNWGGAVVLRT